MRLLAVNNKSVKKEFSTRQTTLHAEGAQDNITRLDAKTKYGRPKWDDIFKGIANNHKGWVT